MNVKSPNFAAQVPGQVRATSPANSGFPNIYAGASGGLVTSTGTRHLSASPFNSIVHRHGSMPNVSQTYITYNHNVYNSSYGSWIKKSKFSEI